MLAILFLAIAMASEAFKQNLAALSQIATGMPHHPRKLISKGNPSWLYRHRDKQQRRSAIKEILVSTVEGDEEFGAMPSKVYDEVAVMSRIAADAPPCFARLLDVYQRKDPIKAYGHKLGELLYVGIVMEWIDGVNLKQGIKCHPKIDSGPPYTELVIRRIIRDVAVGLKFLHERHITHRDVSPENIMVCGKTGQVKLVDFSLSIISDSPIIYDRTPLLYGSPEALQREPHHYAHDLWSLGATAYALHRAESPLHLIDPSLNVIDNLVGIRSLKPKMREHVYPALPEALKDLSPSLRDLITALLSEDPNQRPTAAQVLEYGCMQEVATDLEMIEMVEQVNRNILNN